MQGEDKINLEQIEIGDYVAYREQGSWHNYPMRYAKVDNVTKTQIVIGGKRFDKFTGTERTSYNYRCYIFPLGAQERSTYHPSRGTYADVIRIEQAEHAEEKRKFVFAKFIADNSTSSLVREFDTATLEQAAKLLGYVDEAPPVAGKE